MNSYQIKFTRFSKTHNMDIETASYQSARDMFDELIDGELTEIRKHLHVDKTIKKDDGDYHKSLTIKVSKGTNLFSSIKVPHIKRSININSSLVENVLLLDGFKPDNFTLTLNKT